MFLVLFREIDIIEIFYLNDTHLNSDSEEIILFLKADGILSVIVMLLYKVHNQILYGYV